MCRSMKKPSNPRPEGFHLSGWLRRQALTYLTSNVTATSFQVSAL